MKIDLWVPQAMYNPKPPTFGRIDAFRGSSVAITKITDYDMKIDVCVGITLGMVVPSTFTFVWSLRRTDIDFGSSLIICV